MKIKPFSFLLIAFLCSCSSANINQGVTYYNQGNYDLAAAQWNGPAQQGDYIAQHNLGLLWRDGLGHTPKDLNQAAAWFLKSAQQGYAPAMVRLAGVQSTLGNEPAAISWLNLAASWGNADAIRELQKKNLAAPPADLLMVQQQRETLAKRLLVWVYHWGN
jgi:TPR repeat protein